MNARKALKKCFLSNSALWSDFLDRKEDLNILYYPSAGLDMMPLAMSSSTSGIIPGEDRVFKTPNLFIYTDYFVFDDTSFLNDGRFKSNRYFDVQILEFCRLSPHSGYYQLNFNQNYLDFELGINSGNILFMKVRVTNMNGETFDTYLLYFMHENVNFIEQFLLKYQISVDALMWKRDGTGLGGGRLSHGFLLQLLKKFNTKWLFVWDSYLSGQELYLDNKTFPLEQIPNEILPYINKKWRMNTKKVRDYDFIDEDKINLYSLIDSFKPHNLKHKPINMKDYRKFDKAIKTYLNALAILRELRIAPNSKDFTSQIGEWLVEQMYDGERSLVGNEKFWDIKVGETKIQVKTHAKAQSTSARWSPIKYNPVANVDKLIIIVFSHDYKLKEFYSINWQEALPLIKREKNRDVIYWNHIENYQVVIDELPKQHLISIFK